ncbi:MAG: NAD(P)-binding domain-containing protein [Myxococcales bacterium]|nr:NAD(P)-binding domain-containing protein [Myxococcales bacterium]
MRQIHNLIIGAGPAGLQLAHLLGRQGQEYLVLERSDHAGSFFSHYPRHGRLLSINKRYTGCSDLESRRRYDWNSLLCDDEDLQFTRFTRDYFPSAEDLVAYLVAFAERFELHVEYRRVVTRVCARDQGFEVTTEDGEVFGCARLFVATGMARVNLPEFPGVELCESYDRFSVDPEDYVDQRVFIVGKGNSAFETANELVPTTKKIWVCGTRTIKLAWATHYVGDLRAVNNDFLDTYQLKAQNNVLDGEVRSVRRGDEGELVASVWFSSRQQQLEYRCDRVLLCTGFRTDFDIFDESCTPERRLGDRLPLMTCEWESVNVPNMFFVGTLMQSRDYHKTMSAFIHGFRHNVDALVKLLAVRDGHEGWPGQRRLPATGPALVDTLLERLSTSAPLLLQPGFIGDVIVPSADGSTVDYRPDVPVDFVRERLLGEGAGSLYLVTLEYGEHDGSMDPFAMPRGVGVVEDFYLHPVIRRYEGGALVDRFWLPDDLDNDWRELLEHRESLGRWLEAALGASSMGRDLG